jgi:adenosine deaminase
MRILRLEQHPIRQYFDAGLVATVNTDDPQMFQTSLAEEYRFLEEAGGWTKTEICQLILFWIESSWLPEERKAMLVEEFRNDSSWKK